MPDVPCFSWERLMGAFDTPSSASFTERLLRDAVEDGLAHAMQCPGIWIACPQALVDPREWVKEFLGIHFLPQEHQLAFRYDAEDRLFAIGFAAITCQTDAFVFTQVKSTLVQRLVLQLGLV